MTRRAAALSAAGVIVALAAALLDLLQGAGHIPATDVIDALRHPSDSVESGIVHDLRLPRAAAGLVAGAALAAASALLQTTTRNPLAEPATLGLTAGGALAVTLVAADASLAAGAPTIAVAFVGVIAAGLLISALAGIAGAGPVRIVLAGMAITLALGSITAGVHLLRENETSTLFLWGAGSLLQQGWTAVQAGAIVLAAALAGALALSRALDVAVLGEQTARSLGQRVGLVRLASLALAAVLTAAAVGVAGPIAFAGILAVGIARLARPRGHLELLLVALPWGAAVVVIADVVARLLLPGDAETPAGVVCALIGAPVLVIVARRLHGDDGGGAPAIDRAVGAARWRPAASAALLVALPLVALGALCLGELRIGPGEVLGAVFGSGTPLGEIALDNRAPRLCVALLAGACLAAGGTVLQATVRNPFAGPELVGVTGGASVGAFLVLLAAPAAPRGVLPAAAFAGGLLGMAAVLLLAGARRHSPQRLALVGLAVTAACAAVTTLMVIGAQPAAAIAITWLAGSTYAASWGDFWLLAIPAPFLIAIALLAVPILDVLVLGDETIRTLGVRIGLARGALLAVGAALAATAVAVVGAIAFVGLLAPHIARLVAGGNHRRLLPVAMATGALLLAIADTIGRTAFAPTDLPSGLVVSVLGAPYLAWLLWRTRGLSAA